MWKEITVIQERMKLVTEHVSGEYGVSELADMYGVSRKTVYKWTERYAKEGVDGLKDRSRAPHRHPHAVSEVVEGQILEMKANRPRWGAPNLRVKLIKELREERCPAESTIIVTNGRGGEHRCGTEGQENRRGYF
jgi:transposase